MDKTFLNRIHSKPLFWVLLVNLLAGLWVYLVVSSSLAGSVISIIGIVTVLIGLDRVGLLERLTEAYSREKPAALISLILILLILPFTVRQSPYMIHIMVMAAILGTAALGLNFQMGSTDMVNFACGAFFGMGAYASALFTVKTGLNPWMGIPVAVIAAMVLAYIVGTPTLKTKGYYLSLVTVALQLVFTLLIINTAWVGGPNGVSGISSYNLGSYSFQTPLIILGMKLPSQALYFYLAAAVLIMAGYIASRLHASPIGLSWNAIGQDEIAASCQGINLAGSKLLAFCIGGAFSGVAGALYAHYIGFIGAEDFDFAKSLIIICMVILGGMDNVIGVVTGAVLLTLIDEKLRDLTDYRMLLYGASLLLVLLLRPNGLIPKRVRRYDLLLRNSRYQGAYQPSAKEDSRGTIAD